MISSFKPKHLKRSCFPPSSARSSWSGSKLRASTSALWWCLLRTLQLSRPSCEATKTSKSPSIMHRASSRDRQSSWRSSTSRCSRSTFRSSRGRQTSAGRRRCRRLARVTPDQRASSTGSWWREEAGTSLSKRDRQGKTSSSCQNQASCTTSAATKT